MGTGAAMKIDIPDEVAAALDAEARARGQDINTLATGMLSEAIKMRRVPGILFADGATGRRARVGGTGIEVFEIIDVYELFGRDRDRLGKEFDWLTSHQLDAAVSYYEAFPEDIKPRLKTEEQARAELETLWTEYPQTSPDWPGRRRGALSKALADTA
jgi:uncharacterized protein (DUF433 family)